mmetsp:Transcript_55160/g.83466  ORF Transcript_55160/g.83466 Transcript_55160/m.83466 type:complete len:269 (+) Transcript_55160:1302-2108(+)
MLAIPGEKIAIFMPASAMKAVAIGTQTPAVMRSTAIFGPTSNMASARRRTGPNALEMDSVISSSREGRPAHSPRGPPSSSRPIDTFERIMGIIATRAKILSTSLPRPSKARPRMQLPSNSRRSLSAGSCSPSNAPSRNCCNVRRVFSILYVSDTIVSDSIRLMRGASFITNWARSVSSSNCVRMEGNVLLASSGETTLLAVNAEILSVLTCRSWIRQSVVCAHRSNEEMRSSWSSPDSSSLSLEGDWPDIGFLDPASCFTTSSAAIRS